MRVHIGPQALGDVPEPGQQIDLPAGAARHLQVLRAQPGDPVECFDGAGRAWWAEVAAMQRQAVSVRLTGPVLGPDPELPLRVHIALGMPANDRMDFVVEKATELGMAALQPLVCERSVLRLAGERAEKKVAHWQAVATSAAEQCGRRVVPVVHPVLGLPAFVQAASAQPQALRLLLHPQAAVPASQAPPFDAPFPGAVPRRQAPVAPVIEPPAARPPAVWVLSGPEGGLSPAEVELARAAGFRPVSLGSRVLRADTAPLAWLAHCAVQSAARPDPSADADADAGS